jgi:hypothetical protein
MGYRKVFELGTRMRPGWLHNLSVWGSMLLNRFEALARSPRPAVEGALVL